LTIFDDQCPIPISLKKWIIELFLDSFDTSLTDTHVRSILSLSQLKTLHLDCIEISNVKLHQLIIGLSLQIEHLTISAISQSNYEISFALLSLCQKLKSLHLHYLSGLESTQFDLLCNCIHLSRIEIIGCYLQIPNLSASMQQALQLPSSVFPNLTYVKIM
jgi:hypothetical protein